MQISHANVHWLVNSSLHSKMNGLSGEIPIRQFSSDVTLTD